MFNRCAATLLCVAMFSPALVAQQQTPADKPVRLVK